MRALYCSKKGKEFPMLPARLESAQSPYEPSAEEFSAPLFRPEKMKILL